MFILQQYSRTKSFCRQIRVPTISQPGLRLNRRSFDHVTNLTAPITIYIYIYMYIVIVYYTGNYILITINMSSLWIWQSEDRASWYILIIKPTRSTNFIFGIGLHMFRTITLSIIRSLELYTQQYVYIIQAVCITCMYCCVYSGRLLVMDRETVRNMYSHIPKINLSY